MKQYSNEQQAARNAAWNKYHTAMEPARAAFREVIRPTRETLDTALRAIGKPKRQENSNENDHD